MNAEKLKVERGARSQEEMAFLVGVSQKHVSLMETGRLEIPDLMASSITRGLDNVIVEDRFSLPYDIHEYFWKKAMNRAGALTVSCWIAPSQDAGFGNARLELKFEELETRSYDPTSGGLLILDVMGNPYGPGPDLTPIPAPMQLGWPVDTKSVFPKDIQGGRPACIAARAKCHEFSNPITRPSHKLAYVVSNADGEEDVVLNFSSNNGYKLEDLDTIGFPLYPDFVLERISFRLHLCSLTCPTGQPIFTPFLIRRADERAVPIKLSSPGSIKYRANEKTDSTQEVLFTFGPLLRPVPGYIYSISWEKLIPRK